MIQPQSWAYGVGTQSNLWEQDIFAQNIWKINKMTEFYMTFYDFLWYIPEKKSNSKFYTIFARKIKNALILHDFSRKIFSPESFCQWWATN